MHRSNDKIQTAEGSLIKSLPQERFLWRCYTLLASNKLTAVQSSQHERLCPKISLHKIKRQVQTIAFPTLKDRQNVSHCRLLRCSGGTIPLSSSREFLWSVLIQPSLMHEERVLLPAQSLVEQGWAGLIGPGCVSGLLLSTRSSAG